MPSADWHADAIRLSSEGRSTSEIAEALGPGWDNVKVSRRISGLRLNYVFSFDGSDDQHPLRERQSPGRHPMTVHVAREWAP